MIVIIAKLKTWPGQRAELITSLKELAAKSRLEEGCINYDYYISSDDEHDLVFVEQWETQEHVNQHVQSQHYKNYRAISHELVESRTIDIYNAHKTS